MSLSARLAELGIDLPEIAPPVAAYIPAKVHGDLVYTAGQLPFVSGALPATGKVGDGHGLVPAADAASYARQCALNAIAAAADAAGGVDKLTGVKRKRTQRRSTPRTARSRSINASKFGTFPSLSPCRTPFLRNAPRASDCR